MERESMEYDVVIVGAGPSGLSAACKLKQLNNELNVCVVEKGSEVGAHILSGAVLETRALDELFPEWKSLGAPVNTAVSEDKIYWMSDEQSAFLMPGVIIPKTMNNHGNYIISLGNLCRWLAEQAEALGVEIFPGFTAAGLVYDENDHVKGIYTGDMGVAEDGTEKDSFMPGMELHATYTLLTEGCRGHLGKEIIQKYDLAAGKDPQHYGIGIKELWKVPKDIHKSGLVVHSAGWPLTASNSTGGGFLYHLEDDLIALGLITDLSYTNPHVSPYDEFQRYKHHPVIKKHLVGGERIAYGARAIAKGGIQSQPKMVFPGGLLLGDNAGTLNFAKIKGSHTAMKSGMLAAEAIVEANDKPKLLESFENKYKNSWAYEELTLQRNFGPAQHKWGNFIGGAYAFIDINIFNGKLPWTLKDASADHEHMEKAQDAKKIDYPKPDGKISFDKLSSVFLSNTNHEENQPIHLQLLDKNIPIEKNFIDYDEPAQRYCPAGVYEVLEDENKEKYFQINAQNCVHCKTCDIKDPSQNIRWVTPEGGGGPNYPNM